ncbi:hypothetical protein [Phytomonospora endophytica]|uniref:Uncharacterized protein n=1 Tax=Phytomonospora endophytica TaxID=714109 RepID=A0A841FYP9_9ACTN|nr:hypothetical protein [Phytomonospora endophytica]MBB6038848.1 hypothetical protein [Phytomonospora endophytica]GIG68357.1 hypothetical protein Pen01_46520 [Phytomonospora endophytica]
MTSDLDSACAELETAIADRDIDAFGQAMGLLWNAGQQAPAEELTAILPRCADILGTLHIGMGSQLALMCGAFAERGADPAPLVTPVAEGLREAMRRARLLRKAWRAMGDPSPLPGEETTVEEYDAIVTALAASVGEEEARALAEGWDTLNLWQMPATSLLQLDRSVRAAFPHRAEILEGCLELVDDQPSLSWLQGLLTVLDNEPLLVLHRPSGRGYEVTIAGLGDNFQLHSLLAAALDGPVEEGLLGDLGLDPHWAAVATDAPPEDFGGTAEGRFNPADATGAWIWNEGRPADIPLFEDRRVVVLDPPSYPRSWNNDRQYPMMTGSLTLDRVLPEAEAAAWLAKVGPAQDVPAV